VDILKNEVLHITPTANLRSIFKKGLLKCKPLLPQFRNLMIEELGSKYSENKGLIFTIPESISERDKYLHDFGYWRQWGTPRNIMIETIFKDLRENDNTWDYIQDKGSNLFSYLKVQEQLFSILLIKLDKEETVDCTHAQYNEMGKSWEDMNVRYEHYEQPLVLVNEDISPQKLKVIGSLKVEIGKHQIVTRLKL
jgi:hypothetical protein